MYQVDEYLGFSIAFLIVFIGVLYLVNKVYFHNQLGMISPFVYFYVITNVSNYVLLTRDQPNYGFIWKVTCECISEIEQETPVMTIDLFFKRLERKLLMMLHRAPPRSHDLYMYDLALKNCKCWEEYMVSRNKDDRKFMYAYRVRVKSFRKAVVEHM